MSKISVPAGGLSGSIVLGAPDKGGASTLKWLSPILIGLLLPAAIALTLFPALVAHLQAIIALVMVLMLMICTLAYAATVLTSGDPVALEINSTDRVATVTMASAFATKAVDLPFTDIASLRGTVAYDRDGYSQDGAELTTHDGSVYKFSGHMNRNEVEMARSALGLTSRRRTDR